MSGKGKKGFFDMWCAMDEEITPVFIRLSSVTSPDDIMENEIEAMETFVVHLYSKTCNMTDVNEARKIIFCCDNRSIENIPPMKQALIQHILRSAIQSSKWCQCLNSEHDSRDLCQWGWQKNGTNNGTKMDDPTGGVDNLSRTDKMWMQKRLFRKVQVF